MFKGNCKGGNIKRINNRKKNPGQHENARNKVAHFKITPWQINR